MKKLISIIVFVISIVGCTNNPTHMELVIKSKPNINLDGKNVSSPLMLNFYELDSAEQFSKLDYWTILDKSTDRLNSALISQSKYIILPNEEQTYKILFDKKSKFLGIIGNFRNIESESTWRHVINLNQKEYNFHELEIDGYKIKEID